MITPVVVRGRLLADGGLLNPARIEPTVGADLTVAVSLQAPLSSHESTAPSTPPARPSSWRTGPNISARSSPDELPATSPNTDAALPGDLRIADVGALSLDAMQDLISRYRMAGLPPDIHVAVPVGAYPIMDFRRAAEMIAIGRELTTESPGQRRPQTSCIRIAGIAVGTGS